MTTQAETISGRAQPCRVPSDRHDVRFWGTGRPDHSIRATCEPCAWSVYLESGHDAADFTRLTAMHEGTI